MLRILVVAMSLIMAALPAAVAREIDHHAVLAAHNQWRSRVSVPALTHSAALATSAQAWANHLRDHNACQMHHGNRDRAFGENLYWGSAVTWSDGRTELQKISEQVVVDSWAQERADYDAHANRCAPNKTCGHYTQIVWRTTTTVGCGVAICADSQQQVWVCRYSPPGNWVGERPY
jgi:pathogenesis-related protein 1